MSKKITELKRLLDVDYFRKKVERFLDDLGEYLSRAEIIALATKMADQNEISVLEKRDIERYVLAAIVFYGQKSAGTAD